MNLLTALIDKDVSVFEKALEIGFSDKQLSVDVLIEAIAVLNSARTLGARERDRRIQLLLLEKSLSSASMIKLIVASREWDPIARLAIQSSLSAENRQSLYGRGKGITIKIPTAQLVPRGQSPVAENKQLLDAGQTDDFRSVLLLGSANSHEANQSLLKNHNFSPIRVGAPESLESSLDSPICGIVIDASWWALVGTVAHEQCIRRLLSFSSFIWLKIDTTGLGSELITKLPGICIETRFREPTFTEISLCASGGMIEADIHHLNEAANHLKASDQIRFHPREISQSEAVVLLAAIQKQQTGRRVFLPVNVERVDTSVLTGGRSTAKIVLLRPDDGASPFIAKIDTPENLQKEMIRFKICIEGWQPYPRPELYAHNGTGVMFLSLVDETGDQRTPAPPLFERIAELSMSERGSKAQLIPEVGNLEMALERAIAKLVVLNKRDGRALTISNLCWVKIEPLVELSTNGVRFVIIDRDKPVDIVTLGERAVVGIERLNGSSVCHGDIHSHNILLRHDREPLFIDFANSGPGHPAFDLVRLEASLLYAHFRMAADEERIADCFEEMFKGADIESICAKFPELMASKASLICAKASISARKAALEVLKHFGGSEIDYYNVKIVVACQSLTIPDFQQGIVRAALRALNRITVS